MLLLLEEVMKHIGKLKMNQQTPVLFDNSQGSDLTRLDGIRKHIFKILSIFGNLTNNCV